VREVLAVQAQALVGAGIAPAWIVTLVRENLDLIALDDVAEAGRRFAQEPASVREVFSIVRHELRPGVGLALPEDTTRGSPDVYVSRDESGAFHVETIDSRWLGLRVAEISPEVGSDREASRWLQKHAQSARMLLAQLDVRGSVLKQVAVAAVDRQREFLVRGPVGHVELTRSTIANELALHPSTVARAVHGKVIRTHTGQFIGFHELFGSGVAVRAEMEALLRKSPSSDSQLCIALRARGYTIARRTVAKYRAQLGITAARRR
jgi:RNA polymerase sigma-54 factor